MPPKLKTSSKCPAWNQSIFDHERPLAVKIAEAAQALSISKSSIRRLIERKEIRVINVLRHKMIPVSELERFCNP